MENIVITETSDLWPKADLLTWSAVKPVMYEFHDRLFVMFPKMVGEHKYKFYIYRWDGEKFETALELDGTDTSNGTIIYKPNPSTDDAYYDRASYETGHTTYNTGIFFVSNGSLYVMATYPGYDGTSFGGKFFRFFVFAKYDEEVGQFEMQTFDDALYVPTVAINTTPSADYYDVDGMDDFNLLCPKARIEYNADGTSNTFKIPQAFMDESKLGYTVKVEVDEHELSPSQYTVSYGQVVLNNIPNKGQNNVALTVCTTLSGNPYEEYSYADMAAEIIGSQVCTPWGGTNNSRLFVSGATKRYFYSEVNDPTYFPASNYGVAGYDGEKIIGFGHHYKDLIVFKANSIYTLKYQYGADSNGDMKGLIYSQPVNLDVGCDAPNTIRKINNRLTWLSTKYGVCTLVSTVLEDERNVCVISRNIEEGERQIGLLDEANEFSFAIDFDGKYILFNNQTSAPPFYSGEISPSESVFKDCYPKLTNTYVWDYSISPFYLTERSSVDDSARNTAWFVWDKFYAVAVNRFRKELLTIDYHFEYDKDVYDNSNFGFTLNKLIEEENDYGEPIEAYYQTPMFDFGQYGYLKTVKKMFVQCRGGIIHDTKVTYLTDENEVGEEEPENLVSDSAGVWDIFSWSDFTWGETAYANTYARKCSLKKISMAGVLFENDKTNHDMPIDGIQMTYTLVKEIK